MNNFLLEGFADELSKLAVKIPTHAALDLAGLGVLAVPSVYETATGKEFGKRKTGATELGGLGMLAAGTMKGLKKLKR